MRPLPTPSRLGAAAVLRLDRLAPQIIVLCALHRLGRHVYIGQFLVIFDGMKLRPAGRTERKENLSWQPSPLCRKLPLFGWSRIRR
jgi:hypothetical protein